MPLVEGAGNLVEIAANPAVLGCELPDSVQKMMRKKSAHFSNYIDFIIE